MIEKNMRARVHHMYNPTEEDMNEININNSLSPASKGKSSKKEDDNKNGAKIKNTLQKMM